MKICDLTQSYTSTSGGIKTYINEKRAFIEQHTEWNHILIIPGAEDTVCRNSKHSIYTVSSPYIPGCKPYRVTINLKKVQAILSQEKPDIIELGCAYTLPWAAFKYQKTNRSAIVGFYHTDFPTTYVASAVASILGQNSTNAARKISARYVNSVYNKCDITVAPSRIIYNTLIEYGVRSVVSIPLGVDIRLFHPAKRSERLRGEIGIGDDDILLVYTGRFDNEKRVAVLIDAFRKVPRSFRSKLVLIGEGPLRKKLENDQKEISGLVILPYSQNKEYIAALLASSDIYVTAGPFETFGLSVIEAQASGLPIVGVKSGALLDQVDPLTGILGAVDSSEDMARNMRLNRTLAQLLW